MRAAFAALLNLSPLPPRHFERSAFFCGCSTETASR
jgi:hypothetical protein